MRRAACAVTEPRDGVLCGRIAGCLYEGTAWRAEVDLGHGQSAEALVPHRLPVGQGVGLVPAAPLMFER